RDGEAQRGSLRERISGVERLRVHLAKQCLLAERLAAMREGDDDAMPRTHEAVELGLRLGQSPGRDRGPLCLEREGLTSREGVELRRAGEVERRQILLVPDASNVVRLPDEVRRPVDRQDEIVRYLIWDEVDTAFR